MSVLIDIDLETGDLTQFTSTATDGGHMSVTAGAALVGSYGLSCTIADLVEMYGRKDVTTNTSGVARSRFYFDPNSITLGAGSLTRLITLVNTGVLRIAEINLYYSIGYFIRAILYPDSGTVSTADYAITDAPHFIEFKVARASTAVSSDGGLQLWIDGVSQETISGQDNYDRFNNLSFVSWGMRDLDAGASGTVYLDALVVNDDGGTIGPAGYTLAAGQAGFAETGQAAALLFGRTLIANQQGYAWTGTAAALSRTITGAYTLTADWRGCSVTLQSAGLLFARKMPGTQQSFTLAYQAAGLAYGKQMAAGQASYTETGQGAALLFARRLAADIRTVSLAGWVVILMGSRRTTPAERVIEVEREGRVNWVEREGRLFQVEAESRKCEAE